MAIPLQPIALGEKPDERYARFSGKKTKVDGDDTRSCAQKDCDRILYASHFRRLGEITQVAPSVTGGLFHNRLTHTLKVAQLGKRLAESLLMTNGQADPDKIDLANKLGGLDPHVVYAAGLAHDLGHPPFGHVTEELLDELLLEENAFDGYEGNAQSFRIVTELSLREAPDDEQKVFGLDLTRATLNALLKYPWPRDKQNKTSRKHRKFGFYELTEDAEFKWAQQIVRGEHIRTLEAELMDWADDIAYAVYDLDDFFRNGLIPLDAIARECVESGESAYKKGDECSQFYNSVKQRWHAQNREEEKDIEKYFKCFCRMLNNLALMPSPSSGMAASKLSGRSRILSALFKGPYKAKDTQRIGLKQMTSFLVQRYMKAVQLNGDAVSEKMESPLAYKDKASKREISILKELTWTYLIDSPELAGMQHGHREIIRELFITFQKAAHDSKWALFPGYVRDRILKDKRNVTGNPALALRLIADVISSFTEIQAIDVHRRLTGQSFGTGLSKLY